VSRFADAGWRTAGRFLAIAPVEVIPEMKPLELPGRGNTVCLDTGLPDGPDAPRRPTLILLHALATTGALCWYPSLEALRQRYRVIVFDQRWHGRGIRSADFRLEDCADDVVAVADALGVETFVPVGYSMGSLVAQHTWHRHPDRVAGAVLGASTMYFHPERGEIRALGTAADRIYRRAARRIVPVQEPAPDAVDGRIWAFGQFRSTSNTEVAGAAAALSRFDSSSWIGSMDVPTAVVIPNKDRAIPPGRQRALARALPQSTTYEFDGGHASVVMNAEAFRPALLAACASVAKRLSSSPIATREPQ
jgi:diacylglycerol O-acyltransferase